jgi:hypothetical protein
VERVSDSSGEQRSARDEEFGLEKEWVWRALGEGDVIPRDHQAV